MSREKFEFALRCYTVVRMSSIQSTCQEVEFKAVGSGALPSSSSCSRRISWWGKEWSHRLWCAGGLGVHKLRRLVEVQSSSFPWVNNNIHPPRHNQYTSSPVCLSTLLHIHTFEISKWLRDRQELWRIAPQFEKFSREPVHLLLQASPAAQRL